jgi:hypothetical protein
MVHLQIGILTPSAGAQLDRQTSSKVYSPGYEGIVNET